MVKTTSVDSDALTYYIKKSGMKVGRIVAELGISRQGFDKKRKGKIAFRASEVFVLCTLLNIPDGERQKIFCTES